MSAEIIDYVGVLRPNDNFKAAPFTQIPRTLARDYVKWNLAEWGRRATKVRLKTFGLELRGVTCRMSGKDVERIVLEQLFAARPGHG